MRHFKDPSGGVAVLGMACRFPGAPDLQAYWRMLRDGVDAVATIPAARFDIEKFYEPGQPKRGKTQSRWAGLMDGIEEFDPFHFRISPREAPYIDPQHRLLLEGTWHALENAGIAPADLAGSRTGVFVGISTFDFGNLHTNNIEAMTAYSGIGSSSCAAANRISYTFDFAGPSFIVDTACASSLTALHLAATSLNTGDCDFAVVGAVNVILRPTELVGLSQAQMLSPTGRCRSFSSDADGYVRGEGCGVVVLRRHADAVAAGDRIAAVVRGTAISHVGASNGLSAPNGPAQEAVMRAAAAKAGIDPAAIDYLEAHGTGTSLGDPIEMGAVRKTMTEGRDPGQPLRVGSVKTNIGHLEAAAGMAGLIKTVLSMQNGFIPKTLHFKELNPKIHLGAAPIRIVAEPEPWPRGPNGRLAAVSGFGFAGANAHVVLSDAAQPAQEKAAAHPPHLLTLRARSAENLQRMATIYADALAESSANGVESFCFSANAGRSRFANRLAVIGADRDALVLRLREAAAGAAGPGAHISAEAPRRKSAIAFLFTGQGSLGGAPAKDLYRDEPVFRDVVDRCASRYGRYDDGALQELLVAPREGQLARTRYAQPALYALQSALVALWASWGVRPDFVLGHSVGELAAAASAGVFPLEDGMDLAIERGRLMDLLPEGGGMAAVFAARGEVEDVVASRAGRLAFAALNGPDAVVLAGQSRHLQESLVELAAKGLRAEPLAVSHAFHSPLMDPVLDDLEAFAARISHANARTGFFAAAENCPAPDKAEDWARYWREHARRPVDFLGAMRRLGETDADIFVEIGPKPILLGLARRCLPGKQAVWLASLRTGRMSEREALMEAAAALFAAGCDLDFAALHARRGARRIDVPLYPFERQRYWLEDLHQGLRESSSTTQVHPLLGAKLALSHNRTVFHQTISLARLPFLGSHRIHGIAVFPGAGYAEMALAAGRQLGLGAQIAITDWTIGEALMLPEGRERLVETSLERGADGRWSFEIASTLNVDPGPKAQWISHARGGLDSWRRGRQMPVDIGAMIGEGRKGVDRETFYARLEALGAGYGPHFQGISEVYEGADEGVAWVELPNLFAANNDYVMHPAALDAAFHLVGALATREPGIKTMMVAGAARVAVFRDLPRRFLVYAALRERRSEAPDLVEVDQHLISPEGQIVAEISGLQIKVLRDGREAAAPAPIVIQAAILHDATLADRADFSARLLLVGAGEAAAALSKAVAPHGTLAQETTVADLTVAAASFANFDGVAMLHGARLPAATSHETSMASALLADPLMSLRAAILALNALAGRKPRLIAATRGALAAGGAPTTPLGAAIWGFMRTAAREYPSLAIRLVDLDPQGDAAADARALAAELQDPAGAPGAASEIVWREGRRQKPALEPVALERQEPVRLEISERGRLDRLSLRAAARRAPGAGEIEIEVRAAGLNFRDVLNALGAYPGDPGLLGGEVAGEVVSVGAGVEALRPGDAVFGVATGCFATFAVTDARLVVRKPASLSWTQAAALPIAYLTAWYGLKHLAAMQPGQRVLIHAVSGGVGMAAAKIAAAAGAKIVGTASRGKWDQLQNLGLEGLYDSRDPDFAEAIRADLGPNPIDIAINALTGPFIPATFGLLREGGRFLEIGKAGLLTPQQAAELDPAVFYQPFDLAEICRDEPSLVRAMLQEIVDSIEKGALTASPIRVYPLHEAEKAFRFMSLARHVGKIVVSGDPRRGVEVKAFGRHLITGGGGDLGLALAEWLAGRGVRDLLLIGRRQPDGERLARIEALRAAGSSVAFVAGDVGDANAFAHLLDGALKDGAPVTGVYHLAGQIDDAPLEALEWPRMEAVLRPKIDGAFALHADARLRDAPIFVAFTSLAGASGSPGQAAYAAANAALDAFAAWRRGQGLHGLSIAWGPWAQIGMAARLPPTQIKRFKSLGLGLLEPSAALATVADLLGDGGAHYIVYGAAAAAPASTREDAKPRGAGGGQSSAGSTTDVAAYLQERIAALLDYPKGRLPSLDEPLAGLGIDSLTTLELKNSLTADLGVDIAAEELFHASSLGEIAQRLKALLP